MASTKLAYFVIADISGYTRFLTGVELDHAHDIISDIMNTLVKALRPPFRLAKFEGDAAFLYAASDKVDGAVVQDSIDAAYIAFRKRQRDIRQATTCECQACAQTQTLDVKFICHHGEVVEHTMAGRRELAGKDVILVHRLMKNDASERIGSRAYALFSDASVQAMGVDPQAQGLLAHTEAVEYLGDVACWVTNLHVAWAAETARTRVHIERDDAILVVERDLPAPRATVWEYLTVPTLRVLYQHTDGVNESLASGRRGAGTTNHCMHGKDAVLEHILDWQPYDHVTLTTLLPVPGATKILMSFVLEDRPDGGTHLELRVARPKPKDAPFLEKVAPAATKKFTEEFEQLHRLLSAPVGTPMIVDEPDLHATRAHAGST